MWSVCAMFYCLVVVYQPKKNKGLEKFPMVGYKWYDDGDLSGLSASGTSRHSVYRKIEEKQVIST